MVTFSAMVGFWLNGEGHILQGLWLFAGVLLLSGGASALNQVQEWHLDAIMQRTKSRPIPSHRISPAKAFTISWALIIAGAIVLRINGITPMILGLANVLFYNGIYTPMKQYTWFSIFPGALVGAVPPLIGFTSAGGSMLAPVAIFIATFVFIWQVPHFWLLIIKYGKEYEAAGFASISNRLNQKQIKHLIFSWTLLTSAFLMSYPLFEITLNNGLLYAMLLLNIGFIGYFYRLLYNQTSKNSIRNAFILINSFAMVVFALLVVSRYI